MRAISWRHALLRLTIDSGSRSCLVRLALLQRTAEKEYSFNKNTQINPLTADDVYRRHGEWRRPTDDVYRRHLTYRRFSPSVAHSASSRSWQPFGNYSLHVWVQVQCKAATAFPQSERKRVEARVGSCSRLPTLVALDSRIDGASEISFQTTTGATSGLLVSLKVM